MYTPDRQLNPPEEIPEYPQLEKEKLEEIKELWLYAVKKREFVEKTKYNNYYKIFGKIDEWRSDLLYRLKVEQRVYSYYLKKEKEFNDILDEFYKEYERVTKTIY